MSNKEVENIDLQNIVSLKEADKKAEISAEERAVDGYCVVGCCLNCLEAHSSSRNGTQMYPHGSKRGTFLQ